MITGDNPLTACHVAKELRFTQKKGGVLILSKSVKNEDECWFWETIDQSERHLLTFDQAYKQLVATYDLCLTGEVWYSLNLTVLYVSLYVRHCQIVVSFQWYIKKVCFRRIHCFLKM